MKKTCIMAVCMMVFLAAGAFADRRISPAELPASVQSFISQYFPGKSVLKAKADFNEFEVDLNDGTEIQFSGNGSWKEIETYTGVPAALLPQGITSYVNSNFPGVIIRSVEKEWNGFEIKLTNRMKIYFDQNGNMIGQKYDD